VKRQARRLLILFGNTGGGHRSAASAVAEALQELDGEAAHIELLDALSGGMPAPLDRLGSAYPTMVRLRGWPWAVGYHLLDGPRRVAPIKRGWWSLARAAILQLLRDHPADVILCCHPVFNDPLLRALTQIGARASTSLVTLVTDLIAAHALWFAPGVPRCLVPTAGARQRALACGPSRPRRRTAWPCGSGWGWSQAFPSCFW
jgi:1,2-diacylglycerol 3-beta-galactosyltransferase